jgi:hypothetical protein
MKLRRLFGVMVRPKTAWIHLTRFSIEKKHHMAYTLQRAKAGRRK